MFYKDRDNTGEFILTSDDQPISLADITRVGLLLEDETGLALSLDSEENACATWALKTVQFAGRLSEQWVLTITPGWTADIESGAYRCRFVLYSAEWDDGLVWNDQPVTLWIQNG